MQSIVTVIVGITSLMVNVGFQSSFKIDSATVPEGNTLGWNSGGWNWPRVNQNDQINQTASHCIPYQFIWKSYSSRKWYMVVIPCVDITYSI